MKAIVYTKYGSPDVMQLREVEKPVPMKDEVLVKVHAASVNYSDWAFVRGEPFLVRLIGSGLFKPKYKILGVDVAGRVESVGANVVHFQPGDEVYGDLSESGRGGFAEYVSVSENALALKPTHLTFEEAAAVPQASVVALQGLRIEGQVYPGQKVLINGASGGIGAFAVQIAKSFGAEVTGVCSTRNLEFVRSIGADKVIDYTQQDFTQSGQLYDLIIDIMANRSVSDYRRVLSPKGICVLIGYASPAFMFQLTLQGLSLSKSGNKKVVSLEVKLNKEDLFFLKELIEAGKVVPVIDRRYPLSEVPDAIRHYGERHSTGKVVIIVEHNNKP